MSIIKEAEELFGEMRDATPEEQKNINRYLKNISVPTGVNIFEFLKGKGDQLMNKERNVLYLKIVQRAAKQGYIRDRLQFLMDLESADKKFDLRLEELLSADEINFAHDINGIEKNIVRNKFPATDFGDFVPRYAGVQRMTKRITKTYPCDSCNVEFCSRLCFRMSQWAETAKDKLVEYETAEEEGRLLVLPCKPWDRVYQLFVTDVIGKKLIYKIFQAKVIKITIDRFRTLFSFETLDENKYKSDLTIESFGETVFLTRDEAEKALKEMKNNE